MRIAIFSDIHGNTMALDAVLDGITALGGVDACWFIGDAVAFGNDPVGVIERLQEQPALKVVRGNTDRMTVHDNPDATDNFITLAREQPDRALRTIPNIRGLDWTRGAITSAGYYDWIASFPTDVRVTLLDGTRVLLVHAAPGTDEGAGLRDDQSDDEFRALLDGADADLVIVGHTHKPIDRTIDGVRVWNLGSVSMPGTEDTRAMWTLLEATPEGHTLTRMYSTYDCAEFLRQIDALNTPAAPSIHAFYDGKVRVKE